MKLTWKVKTGTVELEFSAELNLKLDRFCLCSLTQPNLKSFQQPLNVKQSSEQFSVANHRPSGRWKWLGQERWIHERGIIDDFNASTSLHLKLSSKT
jgi:hypothetical protein